MGSVRTLYGRMRGWSPRWLLLAACLGPLVALMVKPTNYSFYMFYPARPPSLLERSQLAAANILLGASAAIGVVAALAMAVRGWRQRQWLHTLAPLVVVFHPFLQPVFFERLDTALNYRWYGKAVNASVIGMTEAEVRAVLGEPARILDFPPGTLWEYDPLPIYFLGSSGQLFFTAGRVRSIDPNDD
jgi:hypothetical protein